VQEIIKRRKRTKRVKLVKRSANLAFLFAAQKMFAAQPTQVRRTFGSELNADIEDNLSTLGFSPYK
jgi:hypothetical protein